MNLKEASLGKSCASTMRASIDMLKLRVVNDLSFCCNV